MHSGGEEAEAHMDKALERLSDAGLEVDGMLGDPDPIAAVQDAVNSDGSSTSVVVSTLPTHLSRWLKLDLPQQASARHGPAGRRTWRRECRQRRSSSATHSMCGVCGNMSTGRTVFSS